MTSVETLKAHWTSFRWAYVFMAWFVVGSFLTIGIGLIELFFYVSIPLFFIAFSKSVSPYLRQTASYGYTAFWAMLGPFFFGVILAVLCHGVAYIFGFEYWFID